MKKNYQIPECKVVKIATISIIASTSPNAAVNLNRSVDAGSIESRRGFSIWDDDEEE